MKKLYVTMLSMLACGAAYALPVGNPSDASLLCDGVIWEGQCADPCDPCVTWCDAWSIRVGFYGDYVFNRHMAVESDRINDSIEHFEMYTNAGLIALNLWDRFDIFTTLGATNFYMTSNALTFATPGSAPAATNGARLELETETHFAWSAGVRATLWECGCTALGAEAQYAFAKPHVRRITVAAETSVYPEHNIDMKYQEWQVGVGLSHRINMFVPYIALKWAGSKAKFDNATFNIGGFQTTFSNLENDKSWGYAVGVSLVDCEKASLTVEGRFGDEKAVHVNGQIRF